MATAFVAQMILIVLMAAASLVDIDEQIIPDEITVPGTLIGLALAAAYPWSLPPAAAWTEAGDWQIGPVHLAAPNPCPPELGEWQGLVAGLVCWWAWCLALAPLRWHGRHGVGAGSRRSCWRASAAIPWAAGGRGHHRDRGRLVAGAAAHWKPAC